MVFLKTRFQTLFSETHSEFPQTSKIEYFAIILNGFVTKPSVLDACGSPGYVSVSFDTYTDDVLYGDNNSDIENFADDTVPYSCGLYIDTNLNFNTR